MTAQRRQRDFERWGELLEFSDLAAFEAGFAGQSRPFSIDLDGLPFDGMFRRGTGGTLFVYFSPALAPQPGRKLPVFSWVGQSGLCTGSALFLSDPALLLSEDLTLAWYLGTPEQPLQETMARVIAAVARSVAAARIAFVGTSGGGYPSLWLAGRFPDSAAFVNAPTTTITGHHARRAVQRFCDVVMAGAPIAEFPAALELPVTPPAPGGGARIIITQNGGDRPFVTRHLEPFLSAAGLSWKGGDILTGDLLLRVGDPAGWGEGHVMPPDAVTQVILQTLDRVEGEGFSGLDLAALHRDMIAAEPGPNGGAGA